MNDSSGPLQTHKCHLVCRRAAGVKPRRRLNHLIRCAFILLTAAALFNYNLQAQKTPVDKPNIILIYIDDLGWQDVGYMGNEFISTRHVDKLAAEGRVFTNAYANAPNCAPSRAAVMSGQYAPRTGVYTVGSSARGPQELQKLLTPKNKSELGDEVVTVAEVLNKVGYVCASIGKWHLGDDPTRQGFDINIGGSSKGEPASYFPPYELPNLTDGPKEEYLTDRLTTEATEFIRKNRKQPFFLYLPHFAVHTPISARKDLFKKYQDRYPYADRATLAYAAMVEATDISVGRIVAAVDQYNLTRKTLIVFYSDNGGHHTYSTLGPLRGGKGEVYEGGIRTPLILRWPGQIARGRSDAPVIGIDLFPTFAAIAGAKTDSLLLDGVALNMNQVGNEAPAERALFWHFPVYLEGYVHSGKTFRATPCSVIRRGRWKLIEFFEDDKLQLYDLLDDEAETRNLALKEPALAQELLHELQAWQQAVHAPIPREPNPLYSPDSPDSFEIPDSLDGRE